MNDLCLEDPCVLFALGRERRAFHKEFRVNQRFPGAPCWARFCGPAWLSLLAVETGMGPDNARRAVQWVLSRPKCDELPYAPKLLFFAGYAGSLQEDLYVGDMVLATEIVDEQGNRWPTTWPGELPAGRWQPPLRRGSILSIPRLASTPDDKRRLGETHHALAVDMESATFAKICSERGIPFGVLRAISDDIHTQLSPELVTLLAGGGISWWRALLAVMRRPRLLPEFLRLARHTKLASQQLAAALGEVLTLTLPWDLEGA